MAKARRERRAEADKADERLIQVLDAIDKLVIRAMTNQALKPSEISSLVTTLQRAHKLRDHARNSIDDRARGL